MAPSPENDNTPKAPDKSKVASNDGTKNKDLKTLSNLNDGELKDLLDEAITYKNPKDREGKSSLFKELLSQAEESERNARAASAGGSEQVRYCNTSAKRSKHRRKPNSISENVMHGGSLDNLAKEELFEVAHQLNRSKRTVSSRQREGGSLPSNVNAGSLADPHFFEEARRRRMIRVGGPPEPMDVDMETVSLLEHDSVAENHDWGPPTMELADNSTSMSAQNNTPKYTTNATIQVNVPDVDDPVHFNGLENVEKKSMYEKEQLSAKVSQTNYSIYFSNYHSMNETTKKVDENGNALHQNSSTKGKKKKADKNVVSCVAAEKLEGHRSDIIHDVNKLLEYIGEDNGKVGGAPNRTNTHHRSNKQLHKHTSEEGPRSGASSKKRAHSTKGKENRTELKKSNSLGEISTTKLDTQFYVTDDDDAGKEGDEVFHRKDSSGIGDKLRERRSWGDVERGSFYKNPSMENIETASSSDFRVVTKKKKTKKRRSSVSGSRRKTNNACSANYQNSSKSDDGERASSSPNPRRKSACSVPHSERSNDSSDDVDSVHSLPIDTSSSSSNGTKQTPDAPISYADIARNTERKLTEHVAVKNLDVSPPNSTDNVVTISKSPTTVAPTPPDVHNIKSFPAINKVTAVKVEKSAKTKAVKPGVKAPSDELSASEPEQFNAPMQIPDVQTIEKLHFMNQPGGVMPAHLQQHVVPPQHIHMQLRTNELYATTNQGYTAVVTVSDSYNSGATYLHQQRDVTVSNPSEKNVEKYSENAITNLSNNRKTKNVKATTTSKSCSENSGVGGVIANVVNANNVVNNNGGGGAAAAASNYVNCDNSRTIPATSCNEDAKKPPPVVILSGLSNSNKDVVVPGLIFGFDVNEQLLSEDICENFVQRFVLPENYSATSHNHEKIVNYIGLAWEDVRKNQSMGKAHYYSDILQ